MHRSNISICKYFHQVGTFAILISAYHLLTFITCVFTQNPKMVIWTSLKLVQLVPIWTSFRLVQYSGLTLRLTSVLGKVLEKLISVRMTDYINENNILSDDQFGFRRGRNCEQMLSNFFHVLSKSLDNRNCNLIDGVFLDFSSAFDKVDHNLLLRKLHS